MSKVHFITQGCSANQADSEVMQGLLAEKNHALVEDEDQADIVVFNTCTVKGPSESFFKKKLAELKEKNKKVILAGCIPQSEKKKEQFKEHSMIGTFQIDHIDEVVNETASGNTITLLKRENKSRLNLPKVRKNDLIEIVPINDGCLSSCTFCKTKQARGNLYSYPSADIVRHISKAVENGAKEIWLTSQDTAVYGLDQGSNIVSLLKEIVSIDRDFMLRVGMGNPDHLKNCIKEYAQVLKDPKVFKFVHIPLQAGSDKVLKDMRREYTADEFKKIVRILKEAIPEITIATDIICGFPTETEEDFEKTLELVREIKPGVINISRYWPRPGTAAALMKQVNGRIIKERTKKLTELFHEVALDNNKKWIGWEGKVFVSEKGKEGSVLGRNYAYKQVVVKGSDDLIGKEVEVKIIDCSSFDLKGEIIS